MHPGLGERSELTRQSRTLLRLLIAGGVALLQHAGIRERGRGRERRRGRGRRELAHGLHELPDYEHAAVAP